jgi:post-segregation antitoxin (ccd killing protein)
MSQALPLGHKRILLSVTVLPDLKKRLEDRAKKAGLSLSRLVEQALLRQIAPKKRA